MKTLLIKARKKTTNFKEVLCKFELNKRILNLLNKKLIKQFVFTIEFFINQNRTSKIWRRMFCICTVPQILLNFFKHTYWRQQ